MATRLTRGALSLSISNHLLASENSKVVNPVILPQASDQPVADWVRDQHENDRDVACVRLQCPCDGGGIREYDIGVRAYQFIGKGLNLRAVTGGPSSLDLDVAAFGSTQCP